MSHDQFMSEFVEAHRRESELAELKRLAKKLGIGLIESPKG